MGPLDGVRVLDLSWLGPGCVTTWLLADLGAEVIKVEPPDGSDNLRSFPPAMDDVSVGHLVLDRHKRSFAVNLRDERGRAAFRAVAATADAIVEGFRPGVADRMGIGYSVLRETNARLVYCAVTGFGAGGPLSDVAAHDLNYVAQTGMLALAGQAAPLPLQAADHLGAALAAFGVAAGVAQARQTGEGLQVESSLFDGALYALTLPVSQYLMLGLDPAPASHFLSGGMAAYDVYRCADGRQLTLASLEAKFWRRFCELTGLADEAELDHHDPSVQARLRDAISASLRGKPRDEWLEIFDGEDVCVAPVLTLSEAAEHPHISARGGIASVEHPTRGPVDVLSGPLRISGHEPPSPARVPAIGDATAALLAEAKIDPSQIEALIEDEVIRVSDR